jgi:hypothetical protein
MSELDTPTSRLAGLDRISDLSAAQPPKTEKLLTADWPLAVA